MKRRALSVLGGIAANPVARTILALLFFAGSLAGLTLTSYADGYVNGGVTWGAHPNISHADVNPLGVNVFLEKEVEFHNVERTLQMVRDGGFKWVRQGFAWNDIEVSAKGDYLDRRNPGEPVNAWDKYDRIVDACQQYGIEIIARLDSPPVWARIPGDDVQTFHKGPPNRYEDYADFVSAVVSRYKGKIKYFQIWNEPNLYGEWGGHPVNPEQYTRLLKMASEAAKSANPDAVIISAALAPTAENSVANLNDVLFLEGMYRAGAAPYFDILSTMLYGLGQSPQARRVDLHRLNFSRPILLRRVMEKNGDAHKPIWISEFAWLSLPPDPPKELQDKNIWGRSVDEATQGRWLVEGYERARKEWPWMGVMSVWHLREPVPRPEEPASYFAIVQPDFTPRPAYFSIQEYSKQLSSDGNTSPTVHEKPLWNALGFPLIYALFGLLSLAFAGFAVASLGRWAGAALDRPRVRYSAAARETARNGAVVVGMALLVALYYKVESVPIMALLMAAWWLLAFLKPSTGIAAVVFTIPFFWYPKDIGQQNLPIVETLLMLVFVAVLARRGISYLLPQLAGKLNMRPATVGQNDNAHSAEDIQSPSTEPRSLTLMERFRQWNKEDPFALPAIALLIVGTLSLLTLADPEFARDSARVYRWIIVEPVLLYFLLTEVIVSRRGLLRVADFFVAAAAGIALFGLWQYASDNTLTVEGVGRVFGVYKHPNNLALYLGRVTPFAACMALFLPWGWRKTLYGLALLPLAATLLLTYSRGAWAAVTLAMLVAVVVGLLWRSRRQENRRARPAWVTGAAAGAILLGLSVAGVAAMPNLPERIVNFDSGSMRMLHWRTSAKMLADRPIFGVGLDQFLNQFQARDLIDPEQCEKLYQNHPRQYIVAEAQCKELYTAHPHNLFLDYWLSLGIMGVLVLLLLLWRYFRVALDRIKGASSRLGADPLGRAMALGLLASMINFLAHGMVDNSYFLMDLAMIFWLSCGLLQMLNVKRETS